MTPQWFSDKDVVQGMDLDEIKQHSLLEQVKLLVGNEPCTIELVTDDFMRFSDLATHDEHAYRTVVKAVSQLNPEATPKNSWSGTLYIVGLTLREAVFYVYHSMKSQCIYVVNAYRHTVIHVIPYHYHTEAQIANYPN